jgi:isoquinoline 1-oxidoreductase beta subunit
MNEVIKIGRRGFLKASAAVGGGMMLGFHIPAGNAAVTKDSEINAWVVVKTDDSVVIRVAHSEMGQGAQTGLAQLVAEELECDWSKVTTEFVDPRLNITRNKIYGGMATVGSRAIRTSHEYVRKAGASARLMLVQAAANRWKVTAADCTVKQGVITHTASGRTLTYGAVAEAAAQIAPPKEVTLKDPATWTIAGQPKMRLDMQDKVTGKAAYAIDVRLDGMLFAAIANSPVFGGKLKSFDDKAIAGAKGVRKVVALPDAVAVVADSYWEAQKALRGLAIEWDNGGKESVSSETIAKSLNEGLAAKDVPVARNDGDVEKALAAEGVKVISAEYRVPYLSHAAMEPMNCTVRFNTDGTLEVWAPTQNAEAILGAAARASGIDPLKINVHLTYSGGGFGRRGGAGPGDYVDQAVAIAKAAGAPVKLVWSREDDIQHDFYRPISSAKMTAALGADGMPVAWNTRISGHSILSTQNPSAIKNNMDQGFLVLFHDNAYDVANLKVDYAMRNSHVPVGYWRSVNHSQNAYFRECFLDELAHAAGQDPYEYRRKLLHKAPKQLAVLEACAKAADWGKPLPAGQFRGIAQIDGYGSFAAAVAEISMNADGSPHVHRVVQAIDPGYAVNPDSINAQMEGSVAWTLSAALYGEITVKDGRVEQGNFDRYRMLLLGQMPKVETVIVPSGGFWGGIGEPGGPAVVPALVNAMLAATGKPQRSLPLIKRGATV